MTAVAVIAHAGKTTGGGLRELRAALAAEGVTDPLWYEVPKSKKAPKRTRRALAAGADLVIVWGGDGTVQRVADELAGTGVPLAIVPAGTANLLATNLAIPTDVASAVDVALHGARRTLDLGVVNGEHFAVMAGVGFDARMIGDADGSLKDRLGRAAYLFTGARNLRARSFDAKVRVDGARWVKGSVTCVLCANVGKIFGGITLFDDAQPDDGHLDVGMVTATGAWQWTRTLSRTVVGRADDSPFVEITQGRRIDVKLDPPVRYELDGGARDATKRLRIEVVPDALIVCVPLPDPARP